MNNIKIKKDEQNGEFYVDFNDISHIFEDSSIIEYYTIEKNDGDSITIAFFDKDENQIFPTKK